MTESVKTRAPQVAVQFAQNNPHRSSFRSRLVRRRICLLPAAKQQIPRATKPRFGMTILWDFQITLLSRIAHTMIRADFSVHLRASFSSACGSDQGESSCFLIV